MKQQKSKLLVTLIIGIAIGYVINEVYNSKDESNIVANEQLIKSYENSRHRISLKQTVELHNNFARRFKKPITALQMGANVNRRNVYEPTEYLYMELDQMKLYLNFSDYVASQNPSNQDISGIAINLGAYNLNKESKKGDYKGRLNVYLTPTYKEGDIETPFYLHYKDANNKYEGSYEPLSNLYNNDGYGIINDSSNSIMEASIFSLTQSSNLEGDISLSFNEMGAIPPRPKN